MAERGADAGSDAGGDSSRGRSPEHGNERSVPERELEETAEAERRYRGAMEDPVAHTHPSTEVPEPRASDTDPRAAKRSERTVAALFLLAGAAGIGFMIAYVTTENGSLPAVKWQNTWLGLTTTVAFLALGAGLTHWARRLMTQQETVGEREPLPSSMQQKKAVSDYVMAGGGATGITRRPLLRRTLLASLVPLGIAPLFLLRDLAGPMPFDKLYNTVWRRGMRLVLYRSGEALKPEDLAAPGSIVTAIPEGYEHDLNVLADSTVQLIKFQAGELQPPTNVDWVVDGIVAYSKICTHLGCATGLYEDSTHYILCPCHQSTFDAARGCRVVFGPAGHPLPQLPLGLDREGHLIAMGDFPVPPGPSFWGRG